VRAVREGRAARADFESLVLRSPEGLVVLDRRGVVRLANPAAEAILGAGPSGLVGRVIRLPAVLRAPREVLIPRPGRKPLPVQVSVLPLKAAGWEPGDAEGGRRLLALKDLRGRKRGERISAAREIHRALLPRRAALRSGGLQAAAWNEFCQDASGDFYELAPLGRGRLGVAVGDVSGHGLGAALMMAQGRAFTRAYWRSGTGLSRVLKRVNDSMAPDMTQGRFMSVLLARFDVRRGTVRCANAGHPPGLVLRARTRTVERIASTAPPIGILAASTFPAGRTLRLAPGDVVLLCSDGVTEAKGPRGRLFGEEGVVRSLRRLAERDAVRIVDGLRADLAAWRGAQPLQDDATVVVVKWTGGAARGA
jgi:serine phosphatase RsbU (regulator of sigma subunit)